MSLSRQKPWTLADCLALDAEQPLGYELADGKVRWDRGPGPHFAQPAREPQGEAGRNALLRAWFRFEGRHRHREGELSGCAHRLRTLSRASIDRDRSRHGVRTSVQEHGQVRPQSEAAQLCGDAQHSPPGMRRMRGLTRASQMPRSIREPSRLFAAWTPPSSFRRPTFPRQ
jgi:hypothetical protein